MPEVRASADVAVAIVFEPDFGERVLALAERAHVWLADTPANARAAHAYWNGPRAGFSVTIFQHDPASPPLEQLGILDVVEEHRWDYSRTHEWTTLLVFGWDLDEAMIDLLKRYGFDRFVAGEHGFEASRPLVPFQQEPRSAPARLSE